MFEVFVSKSESVELGSYESFGIRASFNNETVEYADVTPSKERAYAFAEKLNRLNASPIHLLDLIEDSLGIDL